MSTPGWLLAEELALMLQTTRSALWRRAHGYACVAGLLVAELDLSDRPTDSVALAAAASVAAEKGPPVEAVLSHMHRGLRSRTGHGTWDLVVAGLPPLGPDVGDVGAAIVVRLRAAGAGHAPLDQRTALLGAFVEPAKLLGVVAARRADRRAARRRFATALAGSPAEPLLGAVRRLIAHQELAVVVVGS